jgi:hypothetical protein
MAAEIILDPARGVQEQMQEILALAGSGEHGSPDLDIPAINWYPRPDKPHGGVVRAPDHIAEAHSARMAALNAADDEGAQDESESAPDAGVQDDGTADAGTTGRRSRRGKAAASAEESGGSA